MKTKASILMVLGRDRPGIIAAVTEALYRSGGNLEDVSMTILEGQFAMILIAALPTAREVLLKRSLERMGRKWKLDFFWKKVGRKLKRGETHAKGSETHLLSVMGRDRTGIVYHVSRLLARRGLNITDLNSRIVGEGRKAVYAMFLEVDLPKRFPLRKLESDLASLGRRLRVEIKLRPAERLLF